MDYNDFLTQVIEDGITAAKADYTKPEDKDKLEGSIEGFEACRGKDPTALLKLLQEAQKRTQEAYREQSADYWRIRGFEAEIEWVCNVVSAAFIDTSLRIVPVTVHGREQAARILADGVAIVSNEEEINDNGSP
jgi:hypothetical protein